MSGYAELSTKMTRDESLAFCASALKAQLAYLDYLKAPEGKDPITYTDNDGQTHEINGFVTLVHTETGNLFQGVHMSNRKLCSLVDTVIGSMAERDPDLVRTFMAHMILRHLPETMSPSLKRAFELVCSAGSDDDEVQATEGDSQ